MYYYATLSSMNPVLPNHTTGKNQAYQSNSPFYSPGQRKKKNSAENTSGYLCTTNMNARESKAPPPLHARAPSIRRNPPCARAPPFFLIFLIY